MACEPSYGFLPCSDSDIGTIIFLIIVYGFIMLQGANFLSNGSEMLLEVLSPGLIGGLLLPVLGALPDSIIIIVSGLGPYEQAKEQVAIGIGTLAGSSIMLLTIAWGGSLLVGRCDLENGRAKDKKLTQPCGILSTGVTNDRGTSINSFIMVITVLLFLIIQIPAWVTKDVSIFGIVGAVVCFVVLVLYSIYQVVYPDLQTRKVEAARKKRLRSEMVADLAKNFTIDGGLLDPEGALKKEVVEKLFVQFDQDNSGAMDKSELKGMLTGLELGKAKSEDELESSVSFWMSEFDKDQSREISREELFQGLYRWIQDKQAQAKKKFKQQTEVKHSDTKQAKVVVDAEAALLKRDASITLPQEEDEEDEDDEIAEVEEPMSKQKLVLVAIINLIIGTAICAVFSDPLVGALGDFAKVTKIPPFYVAFVVTPLASNASELVSSFKFAAKKKKKNISLTFSQVYGAVTMNNTLGLGLFMLIIYVQGIPWTFSSEVIAIILVTAIMGFLGGFKRTFSMLFGFLALALYPLAIVVVYVLDEILNHK
eukprot:TRINITY_DN5436_c0_g1_i2.p1 TRINITY_DN5436_c0_g1~~TRINITY_DN5436_c0_g1_i2.p1  ORF type:complete len:558 (-),score=69.45 TRINITY_DN5436_c0_g1_i2:617-2230(-)